MHSVFDVHSNKFSDYYLFATDDKLLSPPTEIAMVFLSPLLYKEVSMGSLTKATLNAARFVSGWVQLQYHYHFLRGLSEPWSCRDDQSFHVLITESHLSICSRYPVTFRQIVTLLVIAIKPEHILELAVERRPAGGMGLTLSVRHLYSG